MYESWKTRKDSFIVDLRGIRINDPELPTSGPVVLTLQGSQPPITQEVDDLEPKMTMRHKLLIKCKEGGASSSGVAKMPQLANKGLLLKPLKYRFSGCTNIGGEKIGVQKNTHTKVSSISPFNSAPNNIEW